ncbi:sialidase family protein [Alicyclobacillus sp. ALC3]|uniref:sialidase family protein n=1 Tax=Alicyclobacillus sp. ALC3 TaxID=2796143 RepID=UPI002379273E|nr:sialidase family protein [Alicyclobacillus sp. ALC3]WDL96954.1 exo-alpha-sialidase [Alicyclobacillus sp. ALC3]
MGLESIAKGSLPTAAQIQQFINVLTGVRDAGPLSLLGPVENPAIAPAVTLQSGSLTGDYQWGFYWITGIETGSGSFNITGRTLVSALTTAQTLSSQQASVSIAGITVPTGVVGWGVVRNQNGGSTWYEVPGSEQFLSSSGAMPLVFFDNVADANLVTAAPSTNTTGTTLGGSSIESILADIQNLQYNVYNIELTDYYSGKINPMKGMQFDGFSDTTKADTFSTTLATAAAAGATSIDLTSVTGLTSGEVIAVLDGTNYEEHLVASISGTTVSFATGDSLTNAYVATATAARTSSVIDTADKLLKSGSVQLGYHYAVTTPSQVGLGATEPSSGRTLVILSNGWIVSASIKQPTSSAGGTLYWYVSKDGGASFSQLCYATNVGNPSATLSVALASEGTTVYTLGSWNSFWSFDATTVPIVVASALSSPDTGQTEFGVECALAVDGSGNLHGVWSSANSTYTDLNIRYGKSTDGGNTWTVTQITTNTTNIGDQNPALALTSSGDPVVVCQNYNGSGYTVDAYYYSASAWNGPVSLNSYTGGAQTNPSVAIDGSGTIHAVWSGPINSTSSAHQIQYANSTDGESTWSASVALTSASYNSGYPSITVDSSNNLWVLFQQANSSGIPNIYEIEHTSGAWGTPTAITSNTTTGAQYASTLWSMFNMNCNFSAPVFVYSEGQSSMFLGSWGNSEVVQATKTAYMSKRISYPSPFGNAMLWLTRAVTVSTTPAATTAAGVTSISLSSVANLALGDTMEIREGSDWERFVIASISSGTVTFANNYALANTYATSAVVARVDDLPQLSLVATGASEAFSNMSWQSSTLNSDGTIEDQYYWSSSVSGLTDATIKITQSTNAPTSITAVTDRYGVAYAV